MPNRERRLRRDIPAELRDITTWPTVDVCALSARDQEIFKKRESAIVQYLAGTAFDDAVVNCGCTRREVNRLINKCLQIDPMDGRIYGRRALVPYSRVKKYFRSKILTHRRGKSGYAGMFSRTLRQYPEIEETLRDLILKKGMSTPAPKIPRAPIRVIFKKFMDMCRMVGIKDTDYPFATDGLAKTSVAAYARSLYRSNTFAMVRACQGKVAARGLKFGTGVQLPSVVHLPYQRVFFDGHRLHGSFIIKVPHKMGGFINKLIERPWLLVIIDAFTRVVIAWHLCLGSEFSSSDVLACIRKAVIPQQKPILKIPKMEFADGAGMPSWDIPELKWAVWSELSLDRALANISDWVRAKVVGTLGGVVNPGQVATPEGHAIMERFFETLEGLSCHLLPNTTGTDTTDARRDDSEGNALKYEIYLSYIEEILAVVVANYNGTPHSELGWRSPLQQLRHYLSEGNGMIQTLPVDRRDGVELLTLRVLVQVRGNIKKGRRPYINYLRERYTASCLSSQPQLIGTKLELAIREDDLCHVSAFLPNGNKLGVLNAMGSWRHVKHTMLTRKETNKLYKNKIIHESVTQEPAQILLDHLEEQAVKNKRAASDYERIRREMENTAKSGQQPSPPLESDIDEKSESVQFEPIIIYD